MKNTSASRIILTLTILLLLFLPALAGSAAGQPAASSAIDFAAIDAYLQAAMKQHRLPGMSVAIVQGDDIVFAKGYGEASPGRPMTPDTPMYIGSTSKTFTSLAVMQLVEQGKLELDAPVKSYIPWFQVGDPESTKTITLRHLLTHTSGLTDQNYNDHNLPDDASLEDAVRDLVHAAPVSAPGESWHYFNPGYAVLGYLVEQTSGQSYGDYIAEHIFQPIGMANAFSEPAQAADLAQGHLALFGFPVPFGQPHRRYGLPEGYLIVSANDMARYLMMIMNDGQVGDQQVISVESLRKMFNPVRLPQHQSYGLGWEIERYYGEPHIYHGGSNEAFKHEAMFFPEKDLGLVIQINMNHLAYEFYAFPGIKFAVADILLNEAIRPVSSLSMAVYGYVTLAVLGVIAFIQALGIFGLSHWPTRFNAMTRRRRLWDVSRHFIIPALILTIVIMLAANRLQRGLTLDYAVIWVPEMMLIALVGTAGDLFQGVAKLLLLASGRVAAAALVPTPPPVAAASPPL